ncbi:MAG: phosphatase PAP2 family protein [Polyangiaceae bacterium]
MMRALSRFGTTFARGGATLPPLGVASLVTVAGFWLWTLVMDLRGSLRWDHVAVALLATVLRFGSAPAQKLFRGLIPLGLVGVTYDAMRFVANVGLSESTVHVCDLRDLERQWFGITSGAERITLHDWLQPRAMAWLDVLCAIPYGAFITVVIGYCLYLLVRDFGAQQRFAWGFLALNLAGFITYHVYPAAPPWYFHQHGCHVDLAAAASAGPNLLRVDSLLGVHYFGGLYGRASDVFGAFPSLHCAYPSLMLAIGWRLHGPLGRTLLALFLGWMAFSAVYLDHHWVIDVLAGASYAFATAFLVGRVPSLVSPRSPAAKIDVSAAPDRAVG